MLLKSFIAILVGAGAVFAEDSSSSSPVRVADVIDGHVHPALCVAKNGDVLAVYNKQGGGGKELLLCRSPAGLGASRNQFRESPIVQFIPAR